jgi:hypothetical protein
MRVVNSDTLGDEPTSREPNSRGTRWYEEKSSALEVGERDMRQLAAL